MSTSVNGVALLARLALSAAFLSAVADRFGLYGPPGTAGVAWGDFAAFTSFTALVNPHVPAGFIPALAWTATILEVLFGVLLTLGLLTRLAAIGSGVLLLVFALAMATSLGVKAPLDYSVLSAAAAALLLAHVGPGKWSIDALLAGRR